MASETFAGMFSPNTQVTLALFGKVDNASELKKMAVAGDINAALLNPQMILSKQHILTAANKAIHARNNLKMITKNIHSEVIYSLSASKSISDAFKKFTIEGNSASLLVVEIQESGLESKLPEIAKKVKGDQLMLSDLSNFTEESLIKKVYKIKDLELEVGTVEEAVIGRMVSKDFVSY